MSLTIGNLTDNKMEEHKLTLVLNYGRYTSNSEPDADIPQRHLSIGTFRFVWGNIGITIDGDLSKEIYIVNDGCIYYDGILYSDMWVVSGTTPKAEPFYKDKLIRPVTIFNQNK